MHKYIALPKSASGASSLASSFSSAYRGDDGCLLGFAAMAPHAVAGLAIDSLWFAIGVKSGGVVTAGQGVMVDANGCVVQQNGFGAMVGHALTGASAAGALVLIIPSN